MAETISPNESKRSAERSSGEIIMLIDETTKQFFINIQVNLFWLNCSWCACYKLARVVASYDSNLTCDIFLGMIVIQTRM